MSAEPTRSQNRLYEVRLDEGTLPRVAADEDHERAVAIFDLVEENAFGVHGREDGPYSLTIAQQDSKLIFVVRTQAARETVADFVVSMTPFRPLLKDYFLVCETYYNAIRTASPRQIEAIDREVGDPVQLERDGAILANHGVTRDLLISRMGGSP